MNKASAQGYDIKIKVNGLKDTLCYLANYYGDKQYIKDSAMVNSSGNITFKGKENLPGGIYLFVFPNKTYFEIMVDKTQSFSMDCDMNDAINSMKVKGSQENTDFYSYLQFIQRKSIEMESLKAEKNKLELENKNVDVVKEKMKAVDNDVISFKNTYIAAHPGAFLTAIFNASKEPEIPEAPLLANGAKDSIFQFTYYKAHYFDNFDLADERILRTPIYHNKVSNYIKNLVLQIPDSLIKECDMIVNKAKLNKETFKYVVWYLTNTYETSNIMGLDAVFVSLVTKYYTKDQAYWVDDATLYKIQDRASILGPILVGKQAKNLVLADTSGNYQSVYNINSPFTVLLFWDPDCGHCKKAVPKVKSFYDKAKSKGLQVYAVNTAVEEDKWKNYIKENKLDWINVADLKTQNNFRHEFDILTTPQIFILDKNKKILAKKIDEETMEKILCKELGIEFIPHPKEKDDTESHH
ncbi:MAG: thioredoxin-like domain-containing protein [Bacteroidota bacterium]